MGSPIKEESLWLPPDEDNLRSESPSARTDRRHSSSASTTTGVTGDSGNSSVSGGRRSRPSVISASSQLPTVREQNQMRAMSLNSVNKDRPSSLAKMGSDEAVVSSKKVLTNFSKVASRNAEKEEARQQQLNRYHEENHGQREVYMRLRRWANSKQLGFRERLSSWIMPGHRKAPMPHIEELKSLARHYYPPRSELKCHVCDFGVGRAEHKVVDLGRLEEYWQTKPDWVDVRWIHAPLGLGLAHSSVEDIYLHDGPTGREFENAASSGWPYLETEVLNFRHRESSQEMRDVYLLLHKMEELHEDLNESTWKADQNASLRSDIDWRADHLALAPHFWTLVSSDMPWQLSEGLAMGTGGAPKDGLRKIDHEIDKQMLSSHPFYKESHLVRNPFRTFHRSDGFLLTLSPMAGINYLDKNFNKHLVEPIDAIFDNDDASAVGHVYQAFAEQGTSTWHRRTVEWFLVYLLTEVGVTPHTMRQGHNAPAMETAYSSVIQDLKRQRYDKWEPNKTVQLVREFLQGIDELTTIKVNMAQKVELFKILQLDVKKHETEDTMMHKAPDNPDGESSLERVRWALKMVEQQQGIIEKLLLDLKHSMEALFQLRSIEQNELAIISDSQNKAIMVFTVVTVIFLPLSFFTSYYGMNLSGIVNSVKTEGYFWKVCGSATLIIVLFTALGAFRHHLRRVMRSRMFKNPELTV